MLLFCKSFHEFPEARQIRKSFLKDENLTLRAVAIWLTVADQNSN
jgi:hypothetical protein